MVMLVDVSRRRRKGGAGFLVVLMPLRSLKKSKRGERVYEGCRAMGSENREEGERM